MGTDKSLKESGSPVEEQSVGRFEGRMGRVLHALVRFRLRERATANALLVGVIGLIVAFTVLNGAFLTVANFRDILVQCSVTAVVAVPSALLIIAGRIDLSIGSTVGLGAVTTGLLLTHGVPVPVGIAAGIVAGALVGCVNGVLVSSVKLSPIIVTLGALTAVRGLALTISPDPLYGFPDGYLALGDGRLFGIPYLVLIAAGVFLVGGMVLARSPVGRHIYAIGVNEEAAYLSGVRPKRIGFALFVATGAAAGLAGVLLAARLGSAPSGALGQGFELDVLTAVLLGGVAFDGGRGSVFGVLLGVLFLAILQNGLTLENVPSATALIVKGALLAGAAVLDKLAGESLAAGSPASRGRRTGGNDGASAARGGLAASASAEAQPGVRG